MTKLSNIKMTMFYLQQTIRFDYPNNQELLKALDIIHAVNDNSQQPKIEKPITTENVEIVPL